MEVVVDHGLIRPMYGTGIAGDSPVFNAQLDHKTSSPWQTLPALRGFQYRFSGTMTDRLNATFDAHMFFRFALPKP